MKATARGLALLSLLVLAAMIVSGCGGGVAPAPTQVAQVQPTAAPPEPTATTAPTDAPPTATLVPTATTAPTDTPAPAPTEEPTATPVVIADATNCIKCHTDEATLQELAVEEPPAESLSEGEG